MKPSIIDDAQLIFSVRCVEARDYFERGHIPDWLKSHFCTGEPTWISAIVADYGLPVSAAADLMSLVLTLHICLAEPKRGRWHPSLKEVRKLKRDFNKIDALLSGIERSGIGVGVDVRDRVEDDDGGVIFSVDDHIRRIRGELLLKAQELDDVPIRNGCPTGYPQCAQLELERLLNSYGIVLPNNRKIELSDCLFSEILERHGKFSRDGSGEPPRRRDAVRYASQKKSLRKTRSE